MHWLQNLDLDLFRFINLELAHPVLDLTMPWFAGNRLFFPAVILTGLILIWKGGARGLLCVLMLALIVSMGDGLVCNTIKQAIGRERPFLVLPEARCLLGKGNSGSMPSSHAANWFAASMVMLIYYRRSLWIMLPVALLVSFSRIYNGVHYPSDVLVGAVLGAGYAAAGVWSLDQLWARLGRRWFPLWWQRFPSLMNPPRQLLPEPEEEPAFPPKRGEPVGPAPQANQDAHWLRLGYLVIILLVVLRWLYLAGGTIQLSEDEAYQWLWSKHPDLSYYSKPPLIAYSHWLSTHLWGDTAFGVRFFAPLIAGLLGILLLRFFAREVNARAGFVLLLIITATPLMAVGATLMTVDPLSVLFWTAAMLAGWRAAQDKGTTADWAWVGLWMGLGFLSKYTALFQLLCWGVFFWLWKPARRHLRRPGPWLALFILLVCMIPVLLWNSQRDWITVTHVAERAGADKAWKLTPRYIGEFLGSELFLLNPVFFVATCWATFAFWRQNRRNPKLVYFFSMGAPLFLVYLLHSLKSRVLPNWIAPSVLPLFCLMVIYWDTRWRLGAVRIKPWLASGLLFGFVVAGFLHDTNLVRKVIGFYLPAHLDPLRRVREWDQVARLVGGARDELLKEGKPVFIIGGHYGIVSQITFHLPEAREGVPESPLVYYVTSATPKNQFYFWPGYTSRKGDNAIFVTELNPRKPRMSPPPAALLEEFESVTETEIRDVKYNGNISRQLRIFVCRGLR